MDLLNFNSFPSFGGGMKTITNVYKSSIRTVEYQMGSDFHETVRNGHFRKLEERLIRGSHGSVLILPNVGLYELP